MAKQIIIDINGTEVTVTKSEDISRVEFKLMLKALVDTYGNQKATKKTIKRRNI